MASSHITLKNPSTMFDPKPYGFSHLSIVEPSTRMIHLAGQVAIDQQGQTPEKFEDQVRMTFTSIKTCLAEAGASVEDIVMLTVYVVDFAENSHIFQLLPEMLAGSEGRIHKPPTAIIPVSGLAVPNVKVEVLVMAAVSV